MPALRVQIAQVVHGDSVAREPRIGNLGLSLLKPERFVVGQDEAKKNSGASIPKAPEYPRNKIGVGDEILALLYGKLPELGYEKKLYNANWAANKRFEISKFKFKIPRARTSELQGSFSAVSKPNFASKYSLESSRRDLHNALLCTVL